MNIFFNSLEKLRDDLSREKFSKISFLIVNSFEEGSINRHDVFQNITSISVYQDDEKAKVWEMYKAETDDMVIFDRCNRVVKHIKWPDSIITNGVVKDYLIKASKIRLCPKPCENVKSFNSTVKMIVSTLNASILSNSSNKDKI